MSTLASIRSKKPSTTNKPVKRGRPTNTGKLTPEVTTTICNAILRGSIITNACALAGVGKTAFYGWMARGREEKEGIYADFVDAIGAAKAEALARLEMTLLRTAAPHDVVVLREVIHPATGEIVTLKTTYFNVVNTKLLMFVLETRYPEIYGRQRRIKPEDRPIEVNVFGNVQLGCFNNENMPTHESINHLVD